MNKFVFPFIFFFFIILKAVGQNEEPRLINRNMAGFLVEYGQPYYYLPEGTRYYVVLVGAKVSYPLYKAKKNFNVSVDLYPNYGFVIVTGDKNYYEIGLNVRLGFNLSLSPNDVISMRLGSGPHYMTAETSKQAYGFLFSDYYLLTYRRNLKFTGNNFVLELETGYRHISNAGLKMPNRSISNFIFGLGIYKTF